MPALLGGQLRFGRFASRLPLLDYAFVAIRHIAIRNLKAEESTTTDHEVHPRQYPDGSSRAIS
jgi:hypothetical protein